MKPSRWFRAVLAALLCIAALGAAAFWPSPPRVTAARPALPAPIVFDELQNFQTVSADPGAAARKP